MSGPRRSPLACCPPAARLPPAAAYHPHRHPLHLHLHLLLHLHRRRRRHHPQVKEVHKEVTETGKAAASAAKKAPRAAEAADLLEEGIATTCAVVEKAGPLLQEVMAIQKALRQVPVVELHIPTVVLVGAPNVGKSSIIRAISTGTPEVNNYPFTTRGVTLGHIFEERGGTRRRFQIMDTPGVLAREDALRNEMESLTLASMKHLPTAVLFVFDLTGLSGDDKSSIEDQLKVRAELRARFPRRPWLDVVSKSDLEADEGALELLDEMGVKYLHTSVETGDGLDGEFWRGWGRGRGRKLEPRRPHATLPPAKGSQTTRVRPPHHLTIPPSHHPANPSALEVEVREMLAQVDQVLAAHEKAQRAAAEAATESEGRGGDGAGDGTFYDDRGR